MNTYDSRLAHTLRQVYQGIKSGRRDQMIRSTFTRLWHISLLISLLFANCAVNVYAAPNASNPAVTAGVDDVSSVQATPVTWEARHGINSAQYQAAFDDLGGRGFRLVQVNGYTINNEDRYAAIWELRDGPAMEARHGLNSAQYQAAFDEMNSRGFRLVYVSGYSINNEDRFAAIWEQRGGPAMEARHGLNSAQYQATFDEMNSRGFRLVLVNGYSVNNEERYVAIWEQRDGPAWEARHGLTNAQYQAAFDDLGSRGFRLVHVSGYTINNEDRYAAIWEQRGGPAMEARHGITSAQYQSTFDDLALRGYKLMVVSGYQVGGEDRYAAIWEQTEEPFSVVPEIGNPVPELASLDGVMQKFMVDRQITGGTLAVMKDGVIIFERGYGWQDRERTVSMLPNAMLRLASVTKPITAAAIRRLIAAGQLNASDRVFCLTGSPANCILNITPSGTADTNAVNITIQHLLDHQGGWKRAVSGDPMFQTIEIANALGVANPPTKQNIAEYMLGRPLDFVPGTDTAYSNFGYLLLGLVVEEITGQSYMSYVQNTIFAPLCAPDIELGHSFPNQRNPREPWYSDPGTARNVFNPSKTVMFPDGGYYIEAMEAHGGLIASGSTMAEFLQAYWIGGEPRSGNGQDWTFFGSLPGTFTMARQRADGINVVALFNKRTDPDGNNDNMIQGMLDSAIDSITTWPAAAATTADVAACPTGPVSTFVGLTGATLDVPSEDTSVIFPAEAVPAPVTVTYTPLELTVGEDYHAIGQFFELNAVDEGGQPVTTFQNPITIVSELPQDLSGASAGSFRLYWLDGDTWSTEGLATVALEGNTLTSTTTHFSTFAILAQAEPDDDPTEPEEPVQPENTLHLPLVQS